MNPTESIHSNGKKVSANKQERRWVVVLYEDDDVVTLNANGEEAGNTLGLSGFMDDRAKPSIYDEIIQYRGTNPDMVDDLGYYHPEFNLITGDSLDEIEKNIQSEIEKEQAKKQEAIENIDLPKERIEALEKANSLIQYYESDKSYLDIAKYSETLKQPLSDKELREVENREKRDEYSQHNRDSDLYAGLPPEVEIVRHDGKYARVQEKEDRIEYDYITNFVINTKAYIVQNKRSGDDDQLYEIEIDPASPEDNPTQRVISADVFNGPREFKEHICSKGRTLTFRGSSHDLPDIKELVSHQIAPEKEIREVVGLHDGMMITPEGVIDEDGWVPTDQAEYVYEPDHEGNIVDDWNIDYDDEFEFDDDEVAEFIEKYWQTRDPDRLLPLIGYVYASALAPEIRDIENEFMNIVITGPSGVGKSNAIEKLQKATGIKKSPNSLDDSLASIRNNLASTNNVPIWIDEYIPAKYGDYKLNQFQQYYKKTAKAEMASKSSESNSNKQQQLQCPLIVTGEQHMKGNAERRRSIQTQFTYDGRTEEREAMWDDIEGGYFEDENGETQYIEPVDLSQHAKAFWKFMLSFDSDEIQSKWRDAKARAFDLRKKYGYEEIQDLELNSLVAVLFGIDLYKELGEQVGVDSEDLPSEDQEESTFTYIASQMGTSNRKSNLDEYVEYIAEAIQMGYIKRYDEHIDGVDEGIYKIVNKGDPDENLRIKLKQSHSKVSKYLKEHGIDIDLLDPQSYRDRMKDNDSYIQSHSQNTPPLGRCVSINTHKAEDHIDEFDRNQIIPQEDEDGW